MEIYLALLDRPGCNSAILGAFPDEPSARKACQDDQDEAFDGQPGVSPVLVWDNDAAGASAPHSGPPGMYWARLLQLGQRTSA